jgi:hypothetical protein
MCRFVSLEDCIDVIMSPDLDYASTSMEKLSRFSKTFENELITINHTSPLSGLGTRQDGDH